MSEIVEYMSEIFKLGNFGSMIRGDCDEDVDLRKKALLQELFVLIRQYRVSFLIEDEIILSKAHVCYRFTHPTI